MTPTQEVPPQNTETINGEIDSIIPDDNSCWPDVTGTIVRVLTDNPPSRNDSIHGWYYQTLTDSINHALENVRSDEILFPVNPLLDLGRRGIGPCELYTRSIKTEFRCDDEPASVLESRTQAISRGSPTLMPL